MEFSSEDKNHVEIIKQLFNDVKGAFLRVYKNNIIIKGTENTIKFTAAIGDHNHQPVL